MNAFASRPSEERAIIVQEAADRLGIPAVIVEKDFWVCWLLGRLFENPNLGNSIVFKGGTSLSKVFGVIHRFSEDIDLSVSPSALGWNEADLDEAASVTQRRKRFEKLENDCAEHVNEKFRNELEHSINQILGARPLGGSWLEYQLDAASKSPVLLFAYPSVITGVAAYIPRTVKIEFGSLTDQRPTGAHTVEPMIADVLPEAFTEPKAEVVALELERSFWEKGTILHAQFHRPLEQPMPDRYARHYSDFAALWRHPLGQEARTRLDLLERVVIHKSRFFASGWANYNTAKPGTFRLRPHPKRIKELRSDYDKMQPMFFKRPPTLDDVLAVLQEAERALNEA